MDKNELKVQALLESLQTQTGQYEDKIADLRVQLTVLNAENQQLRAERDEALESARMSGVSEGVTQYDLDEANRRAAEHEEAFATADVAIEELHASGEEYDRMRRTNGQGSSTEDPSDS